MVKPISVEVIAPVLTDLRHCEHCEIIFGQTEVGKQVHGEELDEYHRTCLNDTCFGLFDQMEQMGYH